MEGQEPTTPQAGTVTEQPKTVPPTDPTPVDPTTVETLPDWAQKEIRELRKEAAANRKAKQEAQEAISKAEEDRLAKERNFEELATKRQAKINELEAQAALAADLTGILSARIQAEIKEWPKEITDMAPPEPVDPRVLQAWVDQARPLVAKLQQAGQTPGNGGRPTPTGTRNRAAEQVAQAQRDYVRSKF